MMGRRRKSGSNARGLAGCAAIAIALFTSSAAASRRYAIVVGVNEGDGDEEVLRYAESDAERMATILRDVGGFDGADVLVLAGVGSDEMRRALIATNARIREESKDALLFVYYSGHGDGSSLHLGGTRFDVGELHALVSGSPARTRVLVTDACRSGALTRIKGGRPGPAFDIRLSPPSPEGVAIVTSSAAGEDAQESDALGASLFTHHLASALLGAADVDLDGSVTLGEAFAYASQHTLRASSTTAMALQHPTFRYDLGGRSDLVLTRPAEAGRRVGVLVFPSIGNWLVREPGPTGAVVAEVVVEVRNTRVALRPGNYEVTLRAPDHLLQGTFHVVEGATQPIDARSLRRYDYARVVRKGGSARRSAWGAFAMVGVRGEMLLLGAATSATVGAQLDLPWMTLQGRIDGGMSDVRRSRVRIRTEEIGASVIAARSLDLGPVTFSLGVEAGGAYFHQQFFEAQTPDRRALALKLGPVASVEVPLAGRTYARLEGRAPTYVVPALDESGATRATPLTWQAAAGFGVSF